MYFGQTTMARANDVGEAVVTPRGSKSAKGNIRKGWAHRSGTQTTQLEKVEQVFALL